MTAVAILSVGTVMIFKALVVILDYQNQLNERMVGQNMLTDQIGRLQERIHHLKKDDPPVTSFQETRNAVINHRPVRFLMVSKITPFPEPAGLFRVEIGLSWADRGRPRHLSRSALIASYDPQMYELVK